MLKLQATYPAVEVDAVEVALLEERVEARSVDVTALVDDAEVVDVDNVADEVAVMEETEVVRSEDVRALVDDADVVDAEEVDDEEVALVVEVSSDVMKVVRNVVVEVELSSRFSQAVSAP